MSKHILPPAVAALIAFTPAGPALGQGSLYEPIGGNGGRPFETVCPQGLIMTGLALRAGDRVDAVAPICAQAFNATQLDERTRAVPGPWAGGPGGTDRELNCPAGYPVVRSIGVQLFRDGRFVDGLSLRCQPVAQSLDAKTGDSFDGVSTEERDRIEGPIGQYSYLPMTGCPPRHVAVGVRGRSGRWIDQIGLVCGYPVVHNPSMSETVRGGGLIRAAETPPKPSDVLDPRSGAPQTPRAGGIVKKRPGSGQ